MLLAARSDIPRPMAVSPERAASAPQVNRHDTVGSTATCCCWLRCVRDYDARIWRICNAAAALLFAALLFVVLLPRCCLLLMLWLLMLLLCCGLAVGRAPDR